jgi:high-affinity K+ transport system ATPase subunit B
LTDGTEIMIARTHVRLLDASLPGHEGAIDKLAFEIVMITSLRPGDLVLCARGDVVPADGVVIEGVASVMAGGGEVWTGSPMRVAGGLQLKSGYLVVRLDG